MPALTIAQASTIIDVALQKGRDSKIRAARRRRARRRRQPGRLQARRPRRHSSLRHRVRQSLGRPRHGFRLAHRCSSAPTANEAQRLFYTTLAAASGGKIVTNPAGILIRDAAGEVIGAVGMSGDTSDNDEICGIAGIEAAGLKADPGGEKK